MRDSVRIKRVGALALALCLCSTLGGPRGGCASGLTGTPAYASAIGGGVYTGVLYASLDQPRINAYLSVSPTGDPVTSQALGGSFNIQAFLDTGASGLLLSDQSRDLLELAYATHNSSEIIFSDVGVGGTQDFHVSDPFYVSAAAFNDTVDVDDPASYRVQTGPLRMQLAGPVPDGDSLEGLDVFGMPLIHNRVMVMDARPTNNLVEVFPGVFLPNTMNTYLYDHGTPFNVNARDTDPGVVPTAFDIRTSKADFSRFTQVTPAGAPGPDLADSPFIGPAPGSATNSDPTPGIRITDRGRSVTGSFLLDTGASVSFISTHLAAQLGIRYVAGTYNTSSPQLELFNPDDLTLPTTLLTEDDVFSADIAGIGGTVKRLGVYFDSLLLSVIGAVPYDPDDFGNIRFDGAPLLISDITVRDPSLPETDPNATYTLDGVFGMNFIVGSAQIIPDPAGGFPGIDFRPGNFDFAVYNDADNYLGFAPIIRAVPEPAAIPLLLPTLLLLPRRRTT